MLLCSVKPWLVPVRPMVDAKRMLGQRYALHWVSAAGDSLAAMAGMPVLTAFLTHLVSIAEAWPVPLSDQWLVYGVIETKGHAGVDRFRPEPLFNPLRPVSMTEFIPCT